MRSHQAIKYYEKGKYEHTKTNIVTGATAHDYKGAKMQPRLQILYTNDQERWTGQQNRQANSNPQKLRRICKYYAQGRCNAGGASQWCKHGTHPARAYSAGKGSSNQPGSSNDKGGGKGARPKGKGKEKEKGEKLQQLKEKEKTKERARKEKEKD